MMTSMTCRLIIKDLQFNRPFILGAMITAPIAVAVSTLGRTAFTIGSVAFITNIIVLGIFLGIYNVVQEREKRSHLFVISLPVSVRQYYRAKLLAMLISFLIPWSVALLTAATVIAVLDYMPDGLLPLLVLLMGFFLQNFCIFLSVTLSTTAEVWVTSTILLTNVSVSLFSPLVMNISSLEENLQAPVAIWPSEVFVILGVECVVMILALSLALYAQSRKSDFL